MQEEKQIKSGVKTSGEERPAKLPLWQKTKQNGLVILWIAAIYVAINLLLVAISELLWLLVPELRVVVAENIIVANLVLTLIAWGGVLLTMTLLPKIISKWRKNWSLAEVVALKFDQLGFSGWLKWRDIGLAASGFVLAMLLRVGLVAAAQTLFPEFNVQQRQDLGFEFGLYSSQFELMMVFILLVIIAPVTEEIIFRGYLFGKLRKRSGFWMTTLLVSLLFGVAHYAGGGWLAVVVTFSLAVVMCLIREISGSIYPSILLHMINNGLAFAALLYLPTLPGAS